ncbi:unnamed protein product [Hyaloperonospora brassicae]|uniref:Fascin domain-containing protein n=1 Tax=Hyaloperonospora brassicae TaxID=162125 RepID=A0AAV0TJM5_HYABA|nr:unnamed protein product [Hyaloperonospora brassicae]CAI5721517.1 unnamed protein product [Hyaloperonospora brassicae]
MDLSEIPFNVPIIIHSIRMQTNLQNPLGSKKARCLTNNRDMYEHVILHRVRDDKVAIQSRRNGRFLQVRTCGECVFDPTEPGDWELFTMETNAECSLYFVSCHTGKVLQCADNGIVQCANQLREYWEAWRIVEPRTSATISPMKENASNPRYALADTERQHVVVELAKCGKTPDEIEQIVTRLFDGPADLYASSSTVAVPVAKE